MARLLLFISFLPVVLGVEKASNSPLSAFPPIVAPLVGESGTSRSTVSRGFGLSGVRVFPGIGSAIAAVAFCSLLGVVGLVDWKTGVDGRITVDGEAGDSGRRKGDVLGDPKERGDGLYEEERL